MKRKSILWLASSAGMISLVSDIYWSGALSYYYMRSLGLDIKYHIVVWTVFSVWNAVDDLIVGNITDRSSHKLGRRIPFIRVFAPLMGLFFCLAFVDVPFARSQWGLAISMFLIICLLDFCVAFLEVCLHTLPYEETLSERERGKVFLVQTLFTVLTILVSILLVPAIQPDVGEDTTLYRYVMYAIGVLSAAAIFVSTFFIDSTYRSDPAKVRSVSLFRYIASCVKNKPFLICEIFGTAIMVVYTMFLAGLYYYLDEICPNSLPCYVAYVLGIAFILFLYWRFFDKLGVRTLAVISALTGGGMMLAGCLAGAGLLSGIFAFFGGGVLLVGYMLFHALMFGYAVDYDESKTGLRREGVYYGFDCLFSSAANASQSIFLAIILAYGYIEHQPAGTQSASAQQGIVVGWLLIPAILMIVSGVLVALFYPLGKEEVKQMKQQILANRAKEAGGTPHGE